jgi:hypothetical protein
MKINEDLVTVVCYTLVPTIQERVMTRSEFNKFNNLFKSKNAVHDDGTFVYEYGLLNGFEDWELEVDIRDWPGKQYEHRYFFRAYEDDVTSYTDDCVYLDEDQSWVEPFKNKDITIRKDPFLSMMSQFKNPNQ